MSDDEKVKHNRHHWNLYNTGCDWQRTSKEPSNNAQHQQVIKIGYLPITHSANLMMTKIIITTQSSEI